MSRKEARTLPNRKKKEKKSVRAKRLKKELMSLTLEEALNRWTKELPKKGAKSEPVDNAIEKAWKALVLNRNPDGGWGRFRGNKSDLWNTAFIVDCLLRVYRYEDIKEHIRGSVEYIVDCCEDFLENVNKNEKKKSSNKTNSGKEKKESREYEIPNSYALARSLSVLLKIKNGGLARKILGYLISIKNPDGGWGWDKFSSSNTYGTAIVVYALMEALESIPKEPSGPEWEWDQFGLNTISSEVVGCIPPVIGEGGEPIKRLSYETVENVCEGIKWIVKDQNRDGGWGSERGSDPKHTSLALLTILHFLEKHSNLKRKIEKDIDKYGCPGIAGIGKIGIDKLCEWLQNQRPSDENRKYSKFIPKISEKGWRVEDSRYSDNIGFEPTAYAVYALIERKKIINDKKFTEDLKGGYNWLLYNQGLNGYWHEDEIADERIGGDRTNFYLALGILVLSLYKKKIDGKELEELLKKDLDLLAKLSNLENSTLIGFFEKPLVVLSWLALFFMAVLAVVVCFLGEDQIIRIHEHAEDLYNFLVENPLYIGLAGLAGLVAKFHEHVTQSLSKLKGRIIYGRKH